MLQFEQHLFHMFFFFSQMTSYCFVHYDVIYYPFPVNNLKMSGGGGGGVTALGVSLPSTRHSSIGLNLLIVFR